MDLEERRQLDMAGQLARVKARARPWRSIIALALALASLVVVLAWGRPLLNSSDHVDQQTGRIIVYAGAGAFAAFGLAAVFELSGRVRDLVRPVIGSSHAGVMRYALALAGLFFLVLIALNLANVPVGQLVVGGAVTGILVGIAAQQALANLFAGLVLLFSRPFRVGERVRFRSGSLNGVIEGEVIDISLAYVRVQAADSVMLLPNSLVLSAVVGSVPADPAGTGDQLPARR